MGLDHALSSLSVLLLYFLLRLWLLFVKPQEVFSKISLTLWTETIECCDIHLAQVFFSLSRRFFFTTDEYFYLQDILLLFRLQPCYINMFSSLRPLTSLQEIQERLRIIELCARDQHFADFVRQTQVWVFACLFNLLQVWTAIQSEDLFNVVLVLVYYGQN